MKFAYYSFIIIGLAILCKECLAISPRVKKKPTLSVGITEIKARMHASASLANIATLSTDIRKLPTLPPIQRDSLMQIFEAYIWETGQLYQERFDLWHSRFENLPAGREKRALQDSLRNLSTLLRKHGIMIVMKEKLPYAMVMPAYLADVFGGQLSEIEKDFARLYQLQNEFPVCDTEGELNAPDLLTPQILRCDILLQHAKKGPGKGKSWSESQKRILEETEAHRTKCIFFLFFGSPKKPSTEAKTNIIKGEFWNPIYQYTRKYPNNTSTPQMLMFIDMLQENNYRLSPELAEQWKLFKGQTN